MILVDDLSEGSVISLPHVLRKKLIKKKIQNIEKLNTGKLEGIFHLAAQGSVPLSLKELLTSNEIEELINLPISYGYTKGSPILRQRISHLYKNYNEENPESIFWIIIAQFFSSFKITITMGTIP